MRKERGESEEGEGTVWPRTGPRGYPPKLKLFPSPPSSPSPLPPPQGGVRWGGRGGEALGPDGGQADGGLHPPLRRDHVPRLPPGAAGGLGAPPWAKGAGGPGGGADPNDGGRGEAQFVRLKSEEPVVGDSTKQQPNFRVFNFPIF